jgi:hypothetical protein
MLILFYREDQTTQHLSIIHMDHITQHLHIIPPIIIPPNMVLHHIYTLVDLPMGLHHHQTVLTVILVDQFIHKVCIFRNIFRAMWDSLFLFLSSIFIYRYIV